MTTKPDPMLPPGTRYCKCSGCGLYFNSVHAFDRHRYGKPTDRKCYTPIQMMEKGWSKNIKGYWITKQRN